MYKSNKQRESRFVPQEGMRLRMNTILGELGKSREVCNIGKSNRKRKKSDNDIGLNWRGNGRTISQYQ